MVEVLAVTFVRLLNAFLMQRCIVHACELYFFMVEMSFIAYTRMHLSALRKDRT